ncbi:hypothetical protein F4808DRAFT_460249 [Astrocystis sublimbata]|nr:hypothetical protein F4808DRAFT_460249 [Astrocystis sublimbata]
MNPSMMKEYVPWASSCKVAPLGTAGNDGSGIELKKSALLEDVVVSASGKIEGLCVAGKTAAGISFDRYVSRLALADCVFSVESRASIMIVFLIA